MLHIESYHSYFKNTNLILFKVVVNVSLPMMSSSPLPHLFCGQLFFSFFFNQTLFNFHSAASIQTEQVYTGPYLCFSTTIPPKFMFHCIYLPPVPMFHCTYVPHNLCFPVSMFCSTYVPLYLQYVPCFQCFLVHIGVFTKPYHLYL